MSDHKLSEGYPTIEDDPKALAITIQVTDGRIEVLYNKPVVSLTITPEQARGMAIVLLQNAEAASLKPSNVLKIPPVGSG